MKSSLALLLVALSATAPAVAQDDSRRLYMRGAAAYGEARYPEAAELFAQAYALRPDPALLYNLGMAREQARDLEGAIDAYERFLSAAPAAAPEREAVEASLTALRAQLAERRPDPPEEIAVAVAETVEEVRTPPEDHRIETPADRAGPASGAWPWLITGFGAASLVGGLVAGGLGQSSYDRAAVEPSYDAAVALEREANDFALGANVAFAVGGALALAGALWGIIELLDAPDATQASLRVGPLSAELSLAW